MYVWCVWWKYLCVGSISEIRQLRIKMLNHHHHDHKLCNAYINNNKTIELSDCWNITFHHHHHCFFFFNIIFVLKYCIFSSSGILVNITIIFIYEYCVGVLLLTMLSSDRSHFVHRHRQQINEIWGCFIQLFTEDFIAYISGSIYKVFNIRNELI